MCVVFASIKSGAMSYVEDNPQARDAIRKPRNPQLTLAENRVAKYSPLTGGRVGGSLPRGVWVSATLHAKVMSSHWQQ